MLYFLLDLSASQRNNSFPFPVETVFYSCNYNYPRALIPFKQKYFEVCLRIDSEAEICNDIINNHEISLPYPHVVWKYPGKDCAFGDNKAREVIAFCYPEEFAEKFREMGMLPEKDSSFLIMTQEIKNLIRRFHSVINNIHSPGNADKLDWIAFSLIKELLFANEEAQNHQSMEDIIKNAALWIKIHCEEDPHFDELAKMYHLSCSKFLREWKKYIPVSPTQYLISARLETAANLLIQTKFPIADIVRKIHFSGTYAFYRKFYEKYHMSPAAYRKNFQNRKIVEKF